MTRVKIDDLPPRVREQVLKGMDKPRPRQTQRVGPHDGKGRWQCHECKAVCLTYAAVERHRDQNRHWRFDQIMGDA